VPKMTPVSPKNSGMRLRMRRVIWRDLRMGGRVRDWVLECNWFLGLGCQQGLNRTISRAPFLRIAV
jgi:hypothetical protein